MKKGLFLMCIVVLLAAAPSASAQAPNSEYKAMVEKILELSGSMTSAKTMMSQMITMLKQQSPAVSASYWNGFQKKWDEKFGNKLAELYAPVYQKYLTLDDLKKIIAFYESPVGKKLGASTPAISVEGMQIGQKLGMEIATELQQELQNASH